MMEFLRIKNITVIFIIFSISKSKATVTFPTDYSTLETRNTDILSTSPKSVVFGDETIDEIDWRRGGIGGLADRSRDLVEQLAAPPMETEDHIRAKRERQILSGEGPNKYNDGPDLILGPSPSPGIELDNRIFQSNDGQYHGNARRYLGAAADLMSTTPFALVTSHLSELLRNVSREDLRMAQSRFNRWRLDHFSVTRPRITTPAIAWIIDPNINRIPNPVFTGSRRMLGPGIEMPEYYVPPKAMIPMLRPPNILPIRPGAGDIEPFSYSPFVFGLQTSLSPPVIPNFDELRLSPIEQFKRLYLTTKPRIRTRKPRPKKPMKPIQPMKDDEYIPEENEEDITTNLIQMMNRPNVKEADENRMIPNFPSFVSDDEGTNTNRAILDVLVTEKEEPFENKPATFYTDGPDKPEDTEIKQFTDYEKSVVSAAKEEPAKSIKNKIADLNDFEHNNTSVKDITDYKKNLREPKIGENIGKIKIDQAPPEVELSEDEEFTLSVHKNPIIKKPELKELEKDLLNISVKAPEDIPKLDKPDLKNKHFIDLPILKEDGNIGNSTEGAFKELMAVPLLELKTGKDDEEMNEQLKTLLMPEDEIYDPLKKSSNEDYVEIKPEEIKGLPIRRKRRAQNKMFYFALLAAIKLRNITLPLKRIQEKYVNA